MEKALELAIETYAEMMGYSRSYVIDQIKKDNTAIYDAVVMLMFSTAI